MKKLILVLFVLIGVSVFTVSSCTSSIEPEREIVDDIKDKDNIDNDENNEDDGKDDGKDDDSTNDDDKDDNNDGKDDDGTNDDDKDDNNDNGKDDDSINDDDKDDNNNDGKDDDSINDDDKDDNNDGKDDDDKNDDGKNDNDIKDDDDTDDNGKDDDDNDKDSDYDTDDDDYDTDDDDYDTDDDTDDNGKDDDGKNDDGKDNDHDNGKDDIDINDGDNDDDNGGNDDGKDDDGKGDDDINDDDNGKDNDGKKDDDDDSDDINIGGGDDDDDNGKDDVEPCDKENISIKVSESPASCDEKGSAKITNYDSSITYELSPRATMNGSNITGMKYNTNYTLTATKNGCTKQVTIYISDKDLDCDKEDEDPCEKENISVRVSENPASCNERASAKITNYDSSITYKISPRATISGSRVTGMKYNTTYTLTATKNGCTKETSINISNKGLDCDKDGVIKGQDTDDSDPCVPNSTSIRIRKKPASCTQKGSARITNYDSSVTYRLSPRATMNGSSITGMKYNTNYTLTATKNNCTKQVTIYISDKNLDCNKNDTSQRFVHKVLLEDATGAPCPNCPRVIRAINLLKNQSNGKYVVPVAIHNYSTSPMNCNASRIIANQLRVQGYPTAYINRRTTWRYPEQSNLRQVFGYIKRNSPIGIKISSSMNTRGGTVNVTFKFNESYQGLKYTVYVIENGYYYYQSGMGNISHKHILRGMAANNAYIGNVRKGQTVSKSNSVSYSLLNNNTSKAEIVVFVSNSSGVLNVQTAHLNQTKNFETR